MCEQVTDKQAATISPRTVAWFRRLAAVLPWLVLLAALGVRVWTSQHHGLMYDEPVTLHLARSVAEGQIPYVDFYEHHTPLPWYALAPLASLSVWRLQRLLLAILGSLGLLGLFLLSRQAWGGRVALFALVLAAVSPLWNRQGNMIIHDAFLVVALVAALWTWWWALQRPTFGRWLLAGACSGLAVLSKQTGILPVLALGVGILCFTRSARAVGAYVLGGLLTCIPWLVLYFGQYEYLYNGFLGWNLAANAHLPPNPKFRPFFNDIFWAHPLLWTGGIVLGLLACRHFVRRFGRSDPRPLAAVAGLSLVLILVFNWFLSHQTFGQYYLQAVPLLALLAASGLDWLARRPWPAASRVALGLAVAYLAFVNPVMMSLTPWTPDLEEKLAIARWLREEVEQEALWEPWVYYAHLAEKDFSFPYAFLSIHSVQDNPALPTITGEDRIALERYLDEQGIQWIVVHDPLLPAVNTRLNRIFTGGPDDWQLVQAYEVTRYASENGYQRSLWTPWWKPVVFYEKVTVWQRHPRPRQGGIVGELAIRNPGDQRFAQLQVFHPGGKDVYCLDDESWSGKEYELRWHQTGHAFFLDRGYRLVRHQSEPQYVDQLLITVGFSDTPNGISQDLYQVRLPAVDGHFCPECAETWHCLEWGSGTDTCERAEIGAVLQLSGIVYELLEEGMVDEAGGE
jgi:hypothetical protein